MTRGQHTKHHGHRWVIGEEIESRGVEIWDIEVAEVEHSKEGGCYVCGSSEHWTADCTAKGRPIHRATCGGMGSLKRWTWWSWQGTIFPTIPGATASVSSQPTGAHAPNMGPRGRRGGLLKGPTEDHHEAEPLMEIVVDNKPLRALVNTGTTYSTVTRGTITDKDLSDKTVGVMGFSGGLEHWQKKNNNN